MEYARRALAVGQDDPAHAKLLETGLRLAMGEG
jgi:hypothetical protein